MNASGASAGYGVLSAASWGASDFVGGIGARRAPALLVTAAGQVVSVVLLAAACFALRIALPGRHDLLFAAIAGFEGALALAIFYRALAMGAMGLTAALTGLLTAVVPVVFSAVHFGLPSALTAGGLAAGCVAIWLITHQPATAGEKAPGRAMALGAVAGAGFGTQLVLFKLASGSSVFSILTVARGAGVLALLLVLAATRPKASGRGYLAAGVLAGLLDTGGNLFYLRAAQLGRLDMAAVISALYPAGTILLAAIVLHERPSRRQWAGMALAVGAVALLSF